MAGEKILVVEDELTMVKWLERILKGSGYGISAAVATGEEAVELARNGQQDLILMDIELAGKIDGMETAEEIRAFSDVPIVFLTGYDDENIISDAKFSEPSAFLLKPVKSRELLANIEVALYRHALERKLREREHRYRSLVELTPEALLVGLDGRIVFANEAAQVLFSASSIEEIVGKKITDIIRVEEESALGGDCLPGVPGALGAFRETEIRRLDGSIVRADVAAAQVETKEGSAIQLIMHRTADRGRAEADIRDANASSEPINFVLPRHIPESVVRSIAFIEKNLDFPMSLEQIAGEASMSKFHFCRIFKKIIGSTPKQYVINLRLRRAMSLLQQKDLNICTVALRAGFNDLSEFNKQFKKFYGSSPSSFRKTGKETERENAFS